MAVAADLAAIYADVFLTVPVAVGARRTRGYLSQDTLEAVDDAGQPVSVTRTVLRLRTGSITPAPTDGTTCVVGAVGTCFGSTPTGTTYVVTERWLVGDGLEEAVAVRVQAS